MYTPPLHPPTLNFNRVSKVGGFSEQGDTVEGHDRSALYFLYVCMFCMSVYIQGLSIDLECIFLPLPRQSAPRDIFFHSGGKLYIWLCVCLYIYLQKFSVVYVCMVVDVRVWFPPQYYSLVPCISVYCMCEFESRPYTTQCMSERKIKKFLVGIHLDYLYGNLHTLRPNSAIPWGRNPDKLSNLNLLYAGDICLLRLYVIQQSQSQICKLYPGINLCKSSSTQGDLHPTRDLTRSLGDL